MSTVPGSVVPESMFNIHCPAVPRLEHPKSQTDRDPALEGTIAWRLAQLSIIKEDPEESTLLPEGRENEPICPGPSIAVPVAA